MAYKCIPDEFKKCVGRPRKEIKEPRKNNYVCVPDELKIKKGRPCKGEHYIPKQKPRNKDSVRNDLGGYTIVMLDYYTMEYIETYKSLKAFEEDNNIPRGYIGNELKRSKNGIAILPNFEVMVVMLQTYRAMESNIAK